MSEGAGGQGGAERQERADADQDICNREESSPAAAFHTAAPDLRTPDLVTPPSRYFGNAISPRAEVEGRQCRRVDGLSCARWKVVMNREYAPMTELVLRESFGRELCPRCLYCENCCPCGTFEGGGDSDASDSVVEVVGMDVMR
jgi:hypothetical protein